MGSTKGKSNITLSVHYKVIRTLGAPIICLPLYNSVTDVKTKNAKNVTNLNWYYIKFEKCPTYNSKLTQISFELG